MLCSEPIQRKPQRGAAEGRPPFVEVAAKIVLALSKAHALALNTAHVLRLNKADVLALNKAHVLRLNNKICPVSKQKPEIFTTMKSLVVDLAHFRAQRPSYFIGKRCMEDRAWV